MSTSFKVNLRCQFCTSRGLPDSKHLILAVNGKLICCHCGWETGKDDDQEIPDPVGDILQLLIQECLLEVDKRNYVFGGTNPASVNLVSKIEPNFRCWIAWYSLGYAERQAIKTIEKIPYLPGSSSELPVEVEQAMRVITSKGFLSTEMPKDRNLRPYARFARNFGDEQKGPPVMVYGDPAKLPMPPVLRVHLELSWPRS